MRHERRRLRRAQPHAEPYISNLTLFCFWQALVAEEDVPLGQLLRGLEQQDQKKCDTDAGGCGAPSAVQHFLLLHGKRAPDVFTLQLAWESTREDPADIRDTLNAITEARHAPLHTTCPLKV